MSIKETTAHEPRHFVVWTFVIVVGAIFLVGFFIAWTRTI